MLRGDWGLIWWRVKREVSGDVSKTKDDGNDRYGGTVVDGLGIINRRMNESNFDRYRAFEEITE